MPSLQPGEERYVGNGWVIKQHDGHWTEYFHGRFEGKFRGVYEWTEREHVAPRAIVDGPVESLQARLMREDERYWQNRQYPFDNRPNMK